MHLALAWLAALALGVAGEENLLSNGDFESGGKQDVAQWIDLGPPTEQAEIGHPDVGAHGGRHCGSIKTTVGAGYTSFTQVIEAPPEGATFARLEGWIKAEEIGANGAGSLLLLMYDPGGERQEDLHSSAKVTRVGGWTRVEVAAEVPAYAKKWMVRCGVSGIARVAFDDVVLTWSKRKRDEVAMAKLAVHHGNYFIATRNAAKAPWIRVSIPFPLEGQTPLAVRVTTRPEYTIARLAVRGQRENRPLEVVLAPTEDDARIELSIDTLVLVRDRPLADGAGVPLAKKGKLPDEVALHLKHAQGVDIDDKTVAKAAKQLARDDLATLMRDATKFLDERLEYEGGFPQGASECLKSGKAVCTGFANVAAALLIAADVPTRILACTQTSGRLQEHYIVESWTPKLGWSRMESTMARFPWADSQNLIVRIVYPDSDRSPYDVPLYVELAGGIDGGFDGDDGNGCWQGVDELSTQILDLTELEPFETAARKSFEALIKTPAAGANVRFAPVSSPVGGNSALRGLLEQVDRWLAP